MAFTVLLCEQPREFLAEADEKTSKIVQNDFVSVDLQLSVQIKNYI